MQFQLFDLKRQFDTFEHQPESQTTGIYELFRDEIGNSAIKFDDPSKEDSSRQLQTSLQADEKPQIVKTTVNTEAVEREIEKLEKLLSETKQHLLSAKDPNEKESLENNNHDILRSPETVINR